MIAVERLVKEFGRVRAVDDLSFEVAPGAVTGFLGPNGAGKSTTMRVLLGLDRPTSGTATIKGRAYADLAHPVREVGALLDAGAMHPGRTGRAHLLVAARSAGLPRSRVDDVLEQVGLGPAASRRVKGYSLGMRQRLGIAAALLGDPEVLLFDEPMNGLDLDGVRWVRALVRRLADEGRCVLLSSHLMSEMQLVADRVVVIGAGRLVQEAGLDELRALGERRVRVRSNDATRLRAVLEPLAGVTVTGPDELEVVGVDADRVGELAHEHGLVLRRLAEVERSLEEAYLQLTGTSVEFRAEDGTRTA